MPPAPVTSALRHWRQRRSQGSANDTAAPARIASSPVPRKQREEPRPPQSFFKSSNCEKNARSFHFQKTPAPAHKQAARCRVRHPTARKSMHARFACWRQNNNIGRLVPLAGRGRPALHNTNYTPGAGGDIMLQNRGSAARAYTEYRVV